jgi:hypothetical protein
LATATYGGTTLGRAGIHHTVFLVSTEGASHVENSPRLVLKSVDGKKKSLVVQPLPTYQVEDYTTGRGTSSKWAAN